MLGAIRRVGRNALEHTSVGYRFLLKRDFGVTGPHGYPRAPWANAVLKSELEVRESVEQVQRLGLPSMTADLPKHWDSLAALDLILSTTGRGSRIFDAGSELYSPILPWLFLYGYEDLTGGNLAFSKKIRRGPIAYEHSDITKTAFSATSVDAVTCLSVIEHGVDLDAYFKEMSRIIRVGGILVTSTDYYETPVDTRNQEAYGATIHIFTREEITRALDLAKGYGFALLSPIDLSCEEKVVHWREYDLHYTFVVFSLRKVSER